MKKFEAGTLEEAYAEAAKEFSCSVTELDIQIVQNPSRGFLGFGRKSAIIVAAYKERTLQKEPEDTKISKEKVERPVQKKTPVKEESTKRVESEADENQPLARGEGEKERIAEPVADTAFKKEQKRSFADKEEDIFGNFYDDAVDINVVVREVEREINSLFSSACFRIEPIRVFAIDDETLQIEFKGEDAALLIGKEGYRYKAMAYLLYNWIHGKYGYKVRLEIAEFLRNQEAMMDSYLEPIVERIENEGRAQTKVLDGILVQIALQKLREKYPQKYVAVRTNKEGGRYVIVNEFMERR